MKFDDLRDVNVVFLGSPWANDLQEKINPARTPLACLGFAKITNYNPLPEEEATDQPLYDPDTKALAVTYALLSALPGVTPETKIISSAGIDTYGTAAGVEFLTSAQGVSELIQRLDPRGRHKLPDFFQSAPRAHAPSAPPPCKAKTPAAPADSLSRRFACPPLRPPR